MAVDGPDLCVLNMAMNAVTVKLVSCADWLARKGENVLGSSLEVVIGVGSTDTVRTVLSEALRRAGIAGDPLDVVRRWQVAVILNGRLVRDEEGMETSVHAGDVVAVIPAFDGG
ncbi:MAG: MoaD/ThiS family protein [Thermodesulfobacteriota bacterium]